jgi:hypothetical protein
VIVTHTQNADGQRRIYLGGKSSLEAYIEPKADNIGWTFHLDQAVTGNQLTDADTKAWAIHTLLKLSEELDVAPDDLAAVPFESIAALHTTSPFEGRRIAAGRRASINHGFLATPPNIRRPQADFTQTPGRSARRQHR